MPIATDLRNKASQIRAGISRNQLLALVLLPVFLIAAMAVAVAVKDVVDGMIPSTGSFAAVGFLVGLALFIATFASCFFWVRTGGFGIFSLTVPFMAVLLLLAPIVAGAVFFKQANPATLPTGNGDDVAFSPDSSYLAVAHTTSPFVSVYQNVGGTWTKLPNPATLPTGNAQGVAWSPDGAFLAVGHATSPFLTIYQLTGPTTLVKLADPATLPAGAGNGLAWSPDGLILAMSQGAGPGKILYSQSGTTFTKLTDPVGGAVTAENNVAWSADSQYLATTGGDLQFFARSGTAFTLVAGTPILASTSRSASWHNSTVMVGFDSTPFIAEILQLGSTFTLQSNHLDTLPGSSSNAAWSADGRLLCGAETSSPFLNVYGYQSPFFTRLADPATLPTGTGRSCAWSPDGGFLAVAHTTTPFVSIYNSSFDDVTPTAPAGLSALVTHAHDGTHALIELRWRLSSNDPDQVSGKFTYRIFLNGVFIGSDTVTGQDGDGVRFNLVDFTGATSTVFWIQAQNPAGFLNSPNSCAVTVDDRVQSAFDDCGNAPGNGPGGSGTGSVAPGDAAGGLKGFCSSLLGASSGSLFLCGLLLAVIAFFAGAGGFYAVTRSTGMPTVVAGIVPGFGVMVFNVIAEIWGIVWAVVLIIIAGAIASFFVKRMIGGGAGSGEES